MKRFLGTTAIALVFASSLAFAQGTSGTSGTTGSGSGSSAPTGTQGVAPGTNAPSTGQVPSSGGAGTSHGATTSGSGTAGTGGSNTAAVPSGSYLSEQSANHWLASNYMGKTVYGPNNERVGDVNDILIDRTGTATAIVVGVGGFLGMGEKNVAVPFTSIQMNPRDGRDELHMNVTKGDLEKAPSFKINRNRS